MVFFIFGLVIWRYTLLDEVQKMHFMLLLYMLTIQFWWQKRKLIFQRVIAELFCLCFV